MAEGALDSVFQPQRPGWQRLLGGVKAGLGPAKNLPVPEHHRTSCEQGAELQRLHSLRGKPTHCVSKRSGHSLAPLLHPSPEHHRSTSGKITCVWSLGGTAAEDWLPAYREGQTRGLVVYSRASEEPSEQPSLPFLALCTINSGWMS